MAHKLSPEAQAAIEAYLSSHTPTKVKDGSAMQQVERTKRFYNALGEFVGGPFISRGPKSGSHHHGSHPLGNVVEKKRVARLKQKQMRSLNGAVKEG